MKFSVNETHPFRSDRKEVSLSPPSPQEAIGELLELIEPGQAVSGVRVVGDKAPYKPSTRQNLRRFELRRIANQVSVLHVMQNYLEYRARDVVLSGMYGETEQQAYDGTFLLYGNEMASVISGKGDYGGFGPERNTIHMAYSVDELSEADRTALDVMRDDIYSGDMEMYAFTPKTTGTFGTGDPLTS